MAEFVLYGIPGSPYLRAALLGLEEKQVPWRLAALQPGESKGEAHLARHPFGRIPVLDHRDDAGGDFRLYETQAILRYLDRILPEPPLTPHDPRAEARMNQLCGITDWYLMPQVSATICFGRVVAPRLGLPVDEARITNAIPQAGICIGEIARLLGGEPFMAGADLSITDLMLAPHLDLLAACPDGRAILARHEALSAWLARMQARPSMVNTGWDRLEAIAA